MALSPFDTIGYELSPKEIVQVRGLEREIDARIRHSKYGVEIEIADVLAGTTDNVITDNVITVIKYLYMHAGWTWSEDTTNRKTTLVP